MENFFIILSSVTVREKVLHNSRGGRLIHSDDVFLHINKEMLCHLHSNLFNFFAVFLQTEAMFKFISNKLRIN